MPRFEFRVEPQRQKSTPLSPTEFERKADYMGLTPPLDELSDLLQSAGPEAQKTALYQRLSGMYDYRRVTQ